MADDSAHAWVFHAGALGDFVLVWPLIRALALRYERVHVVADSQKSELAAAWITPGAIVAHDAHRRVFTRLWSGDAGEVHRDAALVVNAVADPGATWERGAAAMFPGARIVHLGPMGSSSRADAWREAGVDQLADVAVRANLNGPIVCHVGAGSRAKRWPIESWRALRDRVDAGAMLIAGEVEAEQFSSGERRIFDAAGGVMHDSLATLAQTIASARVFIGADTGPTHLAAQLGVPTLALFGPTDARTWSPQGPRVRVLAPVQPTTMDWLTIEMVVHEVEALIA